MNGDPASLSTELTPGSVAVDAEAGDRRVLSPGSSVEKPSEFGHFFSVVNAAFRVLIPKPLIQRK
jgi:hypothetical protein